MRDVEERAGALRAGRPDAKRSNDAGRGEAMPSGRANGIASSIGGGPHRGVAVRLVLTVWIVYALHATTNVVRETYLAMAIGGHGSVRVDPYLGLHSDIFAIPGRGAYINNNPGASILGAVPYALSRPFVAVLVRVKPELARPKPAATYDDPRPNRTKFLNEARRRGLDVTLALAAIATQVGLMAPLGALAAAVMFNFLRARLGDDRRALWLALLYAVATPLLFRSGFLNQNAIIAHCVLFAFVLMAGGLVPSRPLPASAVRGEAPSTRALAGAGAFAGLAVLCDYSGVPLLLAFGGWALVRGWAVGGARVALRSGALFSLGAAVPLLTLLGYQWVAFGHPLFPAQRYMPAVQFSDRGWNGFSAPSAELLWRNLFDARYGLFVFCPMLVAALVAPFLRRRGTVPVAAAGSAPRDGMPTRGELAFIFGASGALYLFNSANQFALLQWNTGVRYMVPAVPLLFLALVPVLLRAPRPLAWAIVVPTLIISWSVAMVRESVPASLARVFTHGPELPVLRVMEKTGGAYSSLLPFGTSPIPLFLLAGVMLWLVWRTGPERARA